MPKVRKKRDLTFPEPAEKNLLPKGGELENLEADFFNLGADERVRIQKIKDLNQPAEEDKIKK